MNQELQKFLETICYLPEFAGLGVKLTGISMRGLFGVTPLHIAAERGELHIISLLLDSGAEIDARGEEGHTPLHEAVLRGHTEAVKLLMTRGANTNIPNDLGQTPKDTARIEGKHAIEILLYDSDL
jgi:ankyrin repeat protein